MGKPKDVDDEEGGQQEEEDDGQIEVSQPPKQKEVDSNNNNNSNSNNNTQDDKNNNNNTNDENEDDITISTTSTTSTTSTSTTSTSTSKNKRKKGEEEDDDNEAEEGEGDDSVKKKKKKEKEKKKKKTTVKKKKSSQGEKKKKRFDGFDEEKIEIEATQATQVSLANLVEASIKNGEEMPSTVEKRKTGQDQPKRRQPAVVQENEEQEDALEFDADGNIIAIQRGPSGPAIDYSSFFETGGIVNYNSFALNRETARRWGKEETNKFYAALKKYGTDFTLMESIFGNRSRSQLKSKFKREERDHPGLIRDLLSQRLPIDIEEFNRDSNKVKENKQRAEAEKKSREDAIRAQEAGEDEENLGEQELLDRENEARAAALQPLRFTNRNNRSEELVIDRNQYQQLQQQKQQQQQQQGDFYDFFSFQSDTYDVGDNNDYY